MQTKNLSVLIAGGASGIGYAVANMFKQAGNQVVIIDHSDQVFQAAKALDIHAIKADVTSEAEIDQAFKELEQYIQTLRVCINCAGIAPAKKIVGKQGAMPLAEFKKVIDVNLIGTFNVMRKAAEKMAATTPIAETGERGVIINTASIAAYEGQIGQAAYSASKGGVVAMTLPAAREFASVGIRVNTISPGLVATPMLFNMPEDVKASLAEQVPFPSRFAEPDEYAKLAMHIVDNVMINGETIRLDGAMRMQAR